jgi:hypothetical protein
MHWVVCTYVKMQSEGFWLVGDGTISFSIFNEPTVIVSSHLADHMLLDRSKHSFNDNTNYSPALLHLVTMHFSNGMQKRQITSLMHMHTYV